MEQQHRSLAGKLLVAPAAMTDPNFADAVTLVLAHTPDGAFGLVIDRRAEAAEVRLPGAWATRLAVDVPDGSVPDGAVPVWAGGPCETDRLVVLARPLANRMPSHFQELCEHLGGLGVVDPSMADPDDFAGLRCFAGYAGWGPGQLDWELSVDAWVVVDALDGDPFDVDVAGLRGRVLGRLLATRGGGFAFPDDPSAN